MNMNIPFIDLLFFYIVQRYGYNMNVKKYVLTPLRSALY